MPEYDSNDKLTLTLDTLRSDVERTPLADSTTVRRRGDQRTRRQAVGGAVAVVALVAGVAGVLGGGGFNQADTQIPSTQGPTASTEVEKPLSLAADPLLGPSDLGTVGEYESWQANRDQAAEDQQKHQCVPSPSTLGGTETVAELLYSDLPASATEHVLRFADTDSAAAASDAIVRALVECKLGRASDNVVQRDPKAVVVPDADSAFSVSREASPPNSEVSYYELGITRKANVLVVLQWSSMGLPNGVTQVWDQARLTSALSTALG
jgi:hypothetical protein